MEDFSFAMFIITKETHDIVLEVLLRLLVLQLDGLHPLDVEQAIDEDLRRLT